MRATWGLGPPARSTWMFNALVLAACNGGGGGCNGKADPVLTFADENNYMFSSGFETTPIEIEAQQDAVVDWSAVTTDIRGRPVDPAAVEQISLLNIKAPPDEVYRMIAENEIGQDDAQDIYLFVNSDGVTSTNLSSFEITNSALDLKLLAENPDQTWLLSMMNVPDGRNDILMTAVVTPKVGAGGDTITFTDGLSALTDVQVDIAGAEPLITAEGVGPYGMDWTAVTKDTFGHEFDSLLADDLLIGHFSGDLASVEANFLQLDTIADALYRMDVFGVTGVIPPDAAFEDAVDADGKAFPGFTKDGTWLVGIICSECATPVPLILGHVEVE